MDQPKADPQNERPDKRTKRKAKPERPQTNYQKQRMHAPLPVPTEKHGHPRLQYET